MAWRFIVQPNGLFARFSEIVDDFTDYGFTEEEALKAAHYAYEMSPQEAQGKVTRAKENPERWEEALDIIKNVHGERVMTSRARELSQPEDLSEEV
jgi:hypothetical protein